MLVRRLSSFPPPRAPPPKRDKLISLFQKRLDEHPTKNLVHFVDDERHSIGQLHLHARSLATGLNWIRCKQGATVLAVVPNNLERLVLQLASLYSGCRITMPEEYNFEKTDIFSLLDTAKPRALFTTSHLVPKVRSAVPELTWASWSKHDVVHPRNRTSNMNSGEPLGLADFPMLKYVFHTGQGREGMFSRLTDLLVRFPSEDPLEHAKFVSLDNDDVFLTVVSVDGKKVIKQASVNEIMSEASRVRRELALGCDEAVLLGTKGDPLSTLVGVVACMDAKSQLILPGSCANKAGGLEQLVQVEKIQRVLGTALKPQQEKEQQQRVAQF